jgi:hypothetical protein
MDRTYQVRSDHTNEEETKLVSKMEIASSQKVCALIYLHQQFPEI